MKNVKDVPCNAPMGRGLSCYDEFKSLRALGICVQESSPDISRTEVDKVGFLYLHANQVLHMSYRSDVNDVSI